MPAPGRGRCCAQCRFRHVSIPPAFRAGTDNPNRISLEPSGAVNEDGPEVVDVGVGRPRRQQIAKFLKEFRRIVVGKKGGRIEAEPAGPGERGLVDEGPGRVLGAPARRRRCRRCRRPAPRCPGVPASATASASAYSWLGPPRPWPRSVTVSSPPDRMTARRPCRPQFARQPRMVGGNVTGLALERGAEQDAVVARRRAPPASTAAKDIGRPRRQRERAWRQTPDRPASGFRSPDRRARGRPTAAGRAGSVPRSRGRRPAWSRSGTVGPEPITAGSSPGTSEIATVTTRAGYARWASRPPLIRDRCLRSVFISPIAAPEASSARVTACFSASEMPGAGAIQLADAPPDISARTRSSGAGAVGQGQRVEGGGDDRLRRVPDARPRPARTTRVGRAVAGPRDRKARDAARPAGRTRRGSAARRSRSWRRRPCRPRARSAVRMTAAAADAASGSRTGCAAATAVRNSSSRKARGGRSRAALERRRFRSRRFRARSARVHIRLAAEACR